MSQTPDNLTRVAGAVALFAAAGGLIAINYLRTLRSHDDGDWLNSLSFFLVPALVGVGIGVLFRSAKLAVIWTIVLLVLIALIGH